MENEVVNEIRELLQRLLDLTGSAVDAGGGESGQMLAALNDFALLNLIRNDIASLRKDYRELESLKDQQADEIRKIGTDIVRNAENKVLEARRAMEAEKDKICDKLDLEIYRSFRRHFNTNLRQVLADQKAEIKSGVFDEVVLSILRQRGNDALPALIEQQAAELKELRNRTAKLESALEKLRSKDRGGAGEGDSSQDGDKASRSSSRKRKGGAARDRAAGGQEDERDTAGDTREKDASSDQEVSLRPAAEDDGASGERGRGRGRPAGDRPGEDDGQGTLDFGGTADGGDNSGDDDAMEWSQSSRTADGGGKLSLGPRGGRKRRSGDGPETHVTRGRRQ